jgi:histone-arginine methyltransferase CARM1
LQQQTQQNKNNLHWSQDCLEGEFLILLDLVKWKSTFDLADIFRILSIFFTHKTRIQSSRAHPGMEGKDPEYFGYYGQLQHQQNMLEDSVRTSTYHLAILQNRSLFEGKVVLDLGAGSGILSFFAAQAGAKRVYAVEASGMAAKADLLAKANGFGNVISVIHSKIEEIDSLPEAVDVIISEPMGVMLFHERMIESFLYARDKFLAPQRRGAASSMFPGAGTIFVAPFTDAPMHADMKNCTQFWKSNNFYGLNLSCLSEIAVDQIFSQPVVGGFDPKTLMAEAVSWDSSFSADSIESLLQIEIPFEFASKFTGIVHGLAGWFSVTFAGPDASITLSTAPEQERTHWQQCRFFFRNPLAVNAGQVIRGRMSMKANAHRSYDVKIQASVNESSTSKVFFLQDQQYHNLTATPFPDYLSEYHNLYN